MALSQKYTKFTFVWFQCQSSKNWVVSSEIPIEILDPSEFSLRLQHVGTKDKVSHLSLKSETAAFHKALAHPLSHPGSTHWCFAESWLVTASLYFQMQYCIKRKLKIHYITSPELFCIGMLVQARV